MDKEECKNCAKLVATQVLQTDIAYIKQGIDRMELYFKEELDKKADRWVEWPVKGLIGLTLVTVVSALLLLILPTTARAYFITLF